MSQIKESLDKLRQATEALENNIGMNNTQGTNVESLHKSLTEVHEHIEFIKQSLGEDTSSPIRYIDECG
ncbi:hypothetical protein N9W11_02170 [Psychrosphaera haliotis]|uniref:hypothetical protein n=1 Tax=Psychrosphaera haliotis TaxID=555083 RepID=UPI00236E4447|nr:hypothetical protein [Psychrosphaera haliotis]